MGLRLTTTSKTKDMSVTKPHLAPYVRQGETVITSGQLAFGPDGRITGDVGDQTRVILDRIAVLLAECGLTLGDVGKTTIWLTNATDFPAFNEAYAHAFGDHKPARSTTVCSLTAPGAVIEIEAIAWPGGGRS